MVVTGVIVVAIFVLDQFSQLFTRNLLLADLGLGDEEVHHLLLKDRAAQFDKSLRVCCGNSRTPAFPGRGTGGHG